MVESKVSFSVIYAGNDNGSHLSIAYNMLMAEGLVHPRYERLLATGAWSNNEQRFELDPTSIIFESRSEVPLAGNSLIAASQALSTISDVVNELAANDVHFVDTEVSKFSMHPDFIRDHVDPTIYDERGQAQASYAFVNPYGRPTTIVMPSTRVSGHSIHPGHNDRTYWLIKDSLGRERGIIDQEDLEALMAGNIDNIRTFHVGRINKEGNIVRAGQWSTLRDDWTMEFSAYAREPIKTLAPAPTVDLDAEATTFGKVPAMKESTDTYKVVGQYGSSGFIHKPSSLRVLLTNGLFHMTTGFENAVRGNGVDHQGTSSSRSIRRKRLA